MHSLRSLFHALLFVPLALGTVGNLGCSGGDGDSIDAGSGSDASEPGPDAGPDAGPESCPAHRGLGRFGAPETTFTLPAPDPGGGLYLPDVQESFPDVDWTTLDRLYLPAAHYSFIRLGNLPDRQADRPLVITNAGGQVRIGALDHHYLFVIGGGSNWVLTGRYDERSQTGDAAFPGHGDCAYAGSAGSYGIVVNDELVRDSVSGIGIGGGATDFEIEYVEVALVGFAGMLIKTDDNASATMRNVRIHDTYIHDTRSEGFYIGSTQGQPQHQIIDLELYNNRVLRSGTEAIQVGQIGGGVRIHHNVFGPSAIDWRDSFQAFQDGNLQLAIRAGSLEVDHNIFLGAAGSMLGLFGAEVADDGPGDLVHIHDNYFAHTRNLWGYINNTVLPSARYRYENNLFRGFHFDRDEVYGDATPYGHLLRIFNSETPIELIGNTWEGEVALTNRLTGGNGSDSNVTGTDNVNGPVAPIAFRDLGVPADYDFHDLEWWAATASRGDGSGIIYEQGEIVFHDGLPYRCAATPCEAGLVPPANPETWDSLPAFGDDVRLAQDSPHAGIGLMD